MLDIPAIWIRFLLVLVAAMLTLPLGGCTPANLFHGRVFLINATGGDLRSPSLLNSHPGLEQKFAFADMADGQAWVRDFRGDDTLVVLGDLKLTYVDRTGIPQTRSVPFQGEVPDYCEDDFFIEIGPNDQLRWGLLISKNYRETRYELIKSHTLAGVTGLILGWLIGRKRMGRRVRSGHAEKSITPEV
jgi:hypothetical protein